MKRFLPALLIFAALCLIAPPPARAAAYPVAGDWFGTGQPDDKSEMYLDHFGADGSFHNQHRWCRQGKIAMEVREMGLWTVKGDILTIAIATVDGQSKPRSDRYRLISVDATTQKYVVLPTNFAYNARRMAADFAMPSCDLTS